MFKGKLRERGGADLVPAVPRKPVLGQVGVDVLHRLPFKHCFGCWQPVCCCVRLYRRIFRAALPALHEWDMVHWRGSDILSIRLYFGCDEQLLERLHMQCGIRAIRSLVRGLRGRHLQGSVRLSLVRKLPREHVHHLDGIHLVPIVPRKLGYYGCRQPPIQLLRLRFRLL
jgi:hypothetical protein